LPPRPGVAASYALRLPQAGDLPTASFGPHLAMIALAVQLTVPVIRVRKGLTPSSGCALPGAQKKGPWVHLPTALILIDLTDSRRMGAWLYRNKNQNSQTPSYSSNPFFSSFSKRSLAH
jgi:hypothetical protein